MYYLRKEFNFKILFLQGLKYFIFGAVMFLVVKILTNYLPVSIISTFIEVIVGGIVYILLLIISKDQVIKMIIENIKKKRNNQKI